MLVSLRAVFDTVEKRNISYTCWELDHELLSVAQAYMQKGN